MYTHLKDRQYYEDMYDRLTVKHGRNRYDSYEQICATMQNEIGGKSIPGTGMAPFLNAAFMQFVGSYVLERYNNRNDYISEQIAQDEAKDARTAAARLKEEPYCQHCYKQELRVIDKILMHRGEKYNDPKEVLFTLECPYCTQRSAFWEDGRAWESKPTLCERCRTEMSDKTKRTKYALTLTYTCPACKHSYQSKIDFKRKKERPDPNYDRDRIYFCLLDKAHRERITAMQEGFEQAARLVTEMKKQQEDEHINKALRNIKRLNISELKPLLTTPLIEAGYTEFALDKPSLGKHVAISFSCLDSKADRSAHASKELLKLKITNALEDTNWRLASCKIEYRLGYMTGKLRAYENDDELKEVVRDHLRLIQEAEKKATKIPPKGQH